MRAIRGGSRWSERERRQTGRMTRRELKQTLSRGGRKWVREVWQAATRATGDFNRLSEVTTPLGNRLVESLDRTRIVLAQTPQAFSYPLLVKAHFEAHETGLAGDDDAQLVAAAGHPVTVVEGEPSNLTLTTAEDLEVLEALLREQEAAAR